MNGDTINRIDDIFFELERIVRTDHSAMRKVSSLFGKLQKTATNLHRVEQLLEHWPRMPQSTITELSTEQSAPFVILMLGLAKRKYTISEFSMVHWWRRMCATGQDHIITYFTFQRLEAIFPNKEEILLASDILRVCTDNEEVLNNVNAALADDRSVDFKIRELLGGLSTHSDVRKAWREWAKTHHPDKGGDANEFLTVKLVYDEWCEIQNKQTQTNNQQE